MQGCLIAWVFAYARALHECASCVRYVLCKCVVATHTRSRGQMGTVERVGNLGGQRGKCGQGGG
eukprot:14871506-Alexandrium_andersonii.AAC.1